MKGAVIVSFMFAPFSTNNLMYFIGYQLFSQTQLKGVKRSTAPSRVCNYR